MRSTVTLYEFMPYGAPELLESRRRHMSRALVLTSAAALALYALTRGVAALLPDAPAPVAPLDVCLCVEPAPEAFVEPQTPAKPKPASVVHAAAAPIPVSHDVGPPTELPGPLTFQGDAIGTDAAITPSEAGTQGQVAETLPAFGTWVYVEQEPAPVKEVKPEYPSIAREAGVEGRVTVHVLVGKEGRVLDAVLATKIQVPMLNEAALAAARQWVFTPGYANGHPVACWTAIPFHFRLH